VSEESVTHFPHSVGYEYRNNERHIVDGSWCGGSGPLKPAKLPPDEIEPRRCPKCIAIWERNGRLWPKTCRCVFVAQDEIDTHECWIHGTSEGLAWERAQTQAKRKLLADKARVGLLEAQKALGAWAKATGTTTSQAAVSLETALMWFDKESGQ